ncbi:lipoprotein N-acyltransferase Lnb domain-containing protein [Winogradskyella immobilis]|uniref:DUF4105 domain-containing protein n=1 Tax=Winogradskyella immobilis TaxID=2816852 RepID=A0ABS8EQT8_9FLAO|nr:DUF4105 domain-containing protein [Winogradskyella immobilis]MCC1484880.1 DUF4105 domain-containing protein [Winogradskyella immobilis]MCG0016972.1 DUF4105 domain-containing protein [Winogradskyella immobilis]
MKKYSLFAILLFLCLSVWSQIPISPQCEISVITIGPGTSLNDAFGHNAFRIKDETRGIDTVYGYGEYDFDTPNFYLKFAQGKLNYLISKEAFSRFYRRYTYFDRTIEEQVLNLTIKQKQDLYNYLTTNYKPENRAYLYDFFFDNCATKIRDVVQTSTDETTMFHTPKDYTSKTFRQLIHQHTGHNTWGSVGIDIALGSVIDRKATPDEFMFLPNYIHSFFSEAKMLNDAPLVKSSKAIYKSSSLGYKTFSFFSPFIVLSIIGLLILYRTYLDYKKGKRTKWLDTLIFFITGFIGIGILFLWFGTDHSATKYNYNLLWAFPLNIILIFNFSKKLKTNWIKGFLKFLIILMTLMTLHWIIGLQIFGITLIPLLFAFLLRYIFLLRLTKVENN